MKAQSETTSLGQYLKQIDRYLQCYPNGVFFRGENADYPSRKPSIGRDPGYLKHEYNLFSDTAEEQSDIKRIEEPIIALAKMQHYNVPTRLLDMTLNPLYALHFACEGRDDQPGYVFLYVPSYLSKKYNSAEVRALALFACSNCQTLNDLVVLYNEKYKTSITEEDMKHWLEEPIFVQFSDEMCKENERMTAQRGTIVICGTDPYKFPEHTINGIDSFPPALTLRIPVEFKASIRQQLKETYEISSHSAYPEIHETGKRLREEYSTIGKAKAKCVGYTVSVEKNNMRRDRRDISVTFVMDGPYDINRIREAIKKECNKYTQTHDVIWIFVAMNKNDVIVKNWRIRGMWINAHWKNTGLKHFDDKDADGYSWKNHSGTSIYSEFNEEHIFKDDVSLCCSFLALYNYVTNELKELIKLRPINEHNLDKLKGLYKPGCATGKAFLTAGDFGRSRNQAFDDYLESIYSFFATTDEIYRMVNTRKDSDKTWWYFLNKYIDRAIQEQHRIDLKKDFWIKALHISHDMINSTDPYKQEPEQEFKYVQTIPMSKSPLLVSIEVHGKLTEDGRIILNGKTNLYDHACLLVSINNGASCKVDCIDGEFCSVPLGKEGAFKKNDTCLVHISLSIPNVQSIEFVKKAGMLYENLSGDFIKREGYSPTGSMECMIVIDS